MTAPACAETPTPGLPDRSRFIARMFGWLAVIVWVPLVMTSFDVPGMPGVSLYDGLVLLLKWLFHSTPRVYPFVTGTVGVLWTLHMLKQPLVDIEPHATSGINMLGVVFSVLASVVYYGNVRQLIGNDVDTVWVIMVYAGSAALLFPFSVTLLTLCGGWEEGEHLIVPFFLGCVMVYFTVHLGMVKGNSALLAVAGHSLAIAFGLFGGWHYLGLHKAAWELQNPEEAAARKKHKEQLEKSKSE